eukprot:PhF_6_TR3480/c0_g1_i1/m.5110
MVVSSFGLELYRPYTNPAYADPKYEKPVVDLMAPITQTKRSDWGTKGAQYGSILVNSLNHVLGVKEEVPYTDTYSTADLFIYGWVVANLWSFTYFMARLSAGCHNYLNPRTKWAHNMIFYSMVFRCNLSYIIGGGGYLYSYEYLYTYVPGVKIDDPSIEGWKDGWKPGQSTFLARNIASLWIFPAHWAYTRTWRRSVMWWCQVNFYNNLWEFGRCFIWNNPQMLGANLSAFKEKEGRLGSLVPPAKMDVDPDTMRTYNASTSEFQKFGSKGKFQEEMWEHLGHDTYPFNRKGTKIPNPYHNPMRSPQGWREEPIKHKTNANPRPYLS